MAVLCKIKHIVRVQQIPLKKSSPKEMKAYGHEKTCARMFITPSLIVDKNGSHQLSLSQRIGKQKLAYLHKVINIHEF